MNKIFFSVIVFLVLLSAYTNAQVKDHNLSLEQAINLTIQNYPLVKQASAKIKSVDAKIKEQKDYYMPNVEGEASYSRIGPIPSIALPGGDAFELYPANNYDAHISARYNIYDFGTKDAALEMTESARKSAVDNVELVKSNLAMQTVKTYYTIIFLKESISVKDTEMTNLKSHLSVTRKKIDNGSATDFDLLNTKVRLSEAESQKLELNNELIKQLINLSKLTGEDIDTSFAFTNQLENVSLPLETDELISGALNKRSEIKLAQDAETTVKLRKHSISLSENPSINVSAMYGLKNGYIPNLDALRGNWAAGINIKVPIFNGNVKEAKIEQTDADIEAAQLHTEELKTNIKAEVKQSIVELNTDKENLKNLKAQINFAEESVTKANMQYQNGVVTNLDLLDAETSLVQARLHYFRALYKSALDMYNLKRAVGEVLK